MSADSTKTASGTDFNRRVGNFTGTDSKGSHMTKIILTVLLAAAIVSVSAHAQTAALRFEVASVKPSKSGDGVVVFSTGGGRRYQGCERCSRSVSNW